MAPRGIYLIGFSGTGKSTIARAVAAELGWPACDLDDLIVERSGMGIPAIFEGEGEAGFRAREAEALAAVSERPPFVVATGGGAPLRDENRRLMARTGWVVALEGRPEVLDARLQRQLEGADPGATRPLLGAADRLDRIRALKVKRQSVYALADWTVHTDRLTPAEVAAEVVRAVRLLETRTQEPAAAFDAPVALPEALAPGRPARVAASQRPVLVRGQPIARGKFPLVCAPLVASGRGALLEEAAEVAAKRPDVVEWRADFFAGVADADEVVELARALKAAVSAAPLLFTLRSSREGGRPVPLAEREIASLYERVCAGGSVDLVDFELASPAEDVRRVREAATRAGVTLVLSHHDLERTAPADALLAKLREAERAGADVAKLAVTPRSREDVLTLLSATLRADEELSIPIVTMSMGALGSLTRACGFAFGSALTFAVGKGSSAPGQVPIEDLRSALDALQRTFGRRR